MKNLKFIVIIAFVQILTSCNEPEQKQNEPEQKQVEATAVTTPIISNPVLKEVSPNQRDEWNSYVTTRSNAWEVRVAARGNAWQERLTTQGNAWNQYLQERFQIVKELEKVNPGRAQEWLEADASNNNSEREAVENLPLFAPYKVRLDAAASRYKQTDLNAQKKYERIDKEAQATFQTIDDSAHKVYADRWER